LGDGVFEVFGPQMGIPTWVVMMLIKKIIDWLADEFKTKKERYMTYVKMLWHCTRLREAAEKQN